MLSFCFTKKSHTVLCGIFLIGVFILIDQIIKDIVVLSGNIDILCNYGIAMGIELPQITFLIMWGLIMICVIYFWMQKISEIFKRGEQVVNPTPAQKFFVQLPYILILSGGISNMFDRVFQGCVIDYIPFLSISSFNVADVFISVGAVIILWQSFSEIKN
ncbi:MAG: signal peptidase II [Patescibacteria group bacterium]